MVSEALVVGGGLAGAGAAALLARAGHRVRLIEREQEARPKVCGEFLSAGAQADLARIGLDIARLGAVPIDRARLICGKREAQAPLPFVACGIARHVLDEALLEHAASQGARIERGVRVTSLGAVGLSTSAGELRVDGPMLLATGKHDVRGARRCGAGETSAYVGFKMHWRADLTLRARLDRMIELVVFDRGYAGIQLVAPDVMNLCLVISRERLAELGGSWDALLRALEQEPGIARRLGGARPLFDRPATIAGLPYGYVCDPGDGGPGNMFRLGDQAAMTASLTGEGMAIALRSAVLAGECIGVGAPAEAYRRRIARQTAGQVRRAMALQRLAERPMARALALALLGCWPGLIGAGAALTRLPPAPSRSRRSR